MTLGTHVQIISNFKSRFTDVNDIALLAHFVASFFMEINIEQVATCVMLFGEYNATTEMVVISLYLALTKYRKIYYLCESSFSNIKLIKI